MPAYDAIQSVISLASLQVLDLSGNALIGNMENAFDLYYCEGGSLGSCDSTATKTGASDMTIVLLASNRIGGGLDGMSLPGSVSVLTVSDNLLHGPVPDYFSQLSVFMAGKRRREGSRGKGQDGWERKTNYSTRCSKKSGMHLEKSGRKCIDLPKVFPDIFPCGFVFLKYINRQQSRRSRHLPRFPTASM